MKVHTQKHFELTAEDVQALILEYLERKFGIEPDRSTTDITFNISPEQQGDSFYGGGYVPAKFNGASVVAKEN
jgi:hypothetical protein